MILLAVLVLHHFLLVCFTQAYYLAYFFLLTLFIFVSTKHSSTKQSSFSIVCVLLTPFIYTYSDLELYSVYLTLDIDLYYRFLGIEVVYLLASLHSFLLFLGYNRKKYLGL